MSARALKTNKNSVYSHPNVYYDKDFLDNIINELMGQVRALSSYEDIGVLRKDLEVFLTRRGLDRKYFVSRLRSLLRSIYPSADRIVVPSPKQLEEIDYIVKNFERYELSDDEANMLGVAYLVLWEYGGGERFFEKGMRVLESISTEKARRNLAVAYAKFAVRLLDSKASFKLVKKYASLAKKYAESTRLRESMS